MAPFRATTRNEYYNLKEKRVILNVERRAKKRNFRFESLNATVDSVDSFAFARYKIAAKRQFSTMLLAHNVEILIVAMLLCEMDNVFSQIDSTIVCMADVGWIEMARFLRDSMESRKKTRPPHAKKRKL